jgi:enoyl-CoA hydratase/carnithine racemase
MMIEFADKYEALLLRRERSRLYVTLNRPEVKNALNPTLIEELKSVFGILRDRRDIKVVILRLARRIRSPSGTGSSAPSSRC